MFSMRSLTSVRDARDLGDGVVVNSSVTPSVASSAVYCLVSAFSGSVRMRTKSSSVSDSSSTRIGNRPCSSGIRSEGLDDVERAGGDEQHVVGLDRPVLGRAPSSPRRSAGGRAARPRARRRGRRAAALAPGDLVDLVDEDDARPARRGGCVLACSRSMSISLAASSSVSSVERLAAPAAAAASCLRAALRQHVAQVELHLFHARCPAKTSTNDVRRVGDVDLDLRSSSLPARSSSRSFSRVGVVGRRLGRRRRRRGIAEVAAPAAARRRARRRRQEQVEQPLLGVLARARRAPRSRSSSRTMRDGGLDEVADHRVDVAADVADLGELGRLDLDERRAGELAPGGARSRSCRRRSGRSCRMFFGVISSRSRRRHLLAPPAVAQRDRHRALGRASGRRCSGRAPRRSPRRQVLRRAGGVAAACACSELLERELRVGVDADVAGDRQRALGDLARRRASVALEQRARRGQRVGAARADRRRVVVGLDHVAGAGEQQRLARGRRRAAAPRAGAARGRCASPWPARRPRAVRLPLVLLELAPRTARTA